MTVLAGSTAGGGTNDFFNSGDLPASPYTTVAAGTPDQAQVVIRSGSTFTSLTIGIWADSSGNPGAKIGQFTAITDNTAGTKIVGGYTGSALTLSQAIWVGALTLGGAFNDTGNSTGSGYKGRTGQASLPDPFGATDFADATATLTLPILVEQVGSAAAPVTPPTFQAIPFMR